VLIVMVEVKEMPYLEKHNEILGYMKLVEGFAPKLVKNELGAEKVKELRRIWGDGIGPIKEDASDKEKYEVAYRNFMYCWVSANNFMTKHKGTEGTEKFMREAINAWKRKYARQALLRKTIGMVSSKASFRSVAKQLAYNLQVFSPFSVTELDDKHMILAIAPCKILETREGNNFCLMACQNIIPSWLQSQFDINMNLNRQGANCQAIFKPF
jgi:hypothetical protein